MRQPPRQPPRQQPKAAARRQPPRATAKGGAAKGGAAKAGGRQQQAKTAARAAQHARDAQRQSQRARQQQAARGRGRQQAGRAQRQGQPPRGWRSWWATHEMDKRSRTRRRGARVAVGGGFGVVNSFGGPRAAAVLTLLLLTFFTGAVAVGAQSVAAAVLAFLFLAGAIAVVTAARARHHFDTDPVETEAPLEKVAEFHIEDLTTEEEPSEAEVNSLADLERSFEHENDKTEPPAPAAPIPMPAAPSPAESTAPSKTVITVAVPEAPATETETPRPKPEPDESDPLATAEAAHDTIAAEAADRPAPTNGQPATDDTEPDSEDEDEEDADPDEDDEAPATSDSDEEAPAAEPTDDDADIAALMAPLLDAGDLTDEADGQDVAPDPETTAETVAETASPAEPEAPSEPGTTAAPGTALSLLAAETPGAAPQFPGVSSIPPEAVRDVAATLIVSDLSRSIMFYTELLGLVEVDRAPDAVLLEAGFGRVLLWRRDDAPGAGDPVMHLTFEVGDIDAAYESMRAKGIEFTHPPRAALSGEVHDLRAASFLDPDGHGLAITELREHPTRV